LPWNHDFLAGNAVFHPGNFNFLPGGLKFQPWNANFHPCRLVLNNLREFSRSGCRHWSKNATTGLIRASGKKMRNLQIF
jgi:hypothetical protein